MNTLKKYFTKECAKRTFRTFIQTERELLKSELPEEFYNAVIAVWGDTPIVAEPEVI